MTLLRTLATRHPRTVSAVAFGAVTMVVIHLAWLPSARTSGLTPALTVAAGLAHALAAAFTAPRLLNGARTRSLSHAAIIGACTSLLALALFSPSYAAFLLATELHRTSLFSYFAVPLFIAVFGFLAAGWALLLVSIVVACVLYRIANTGPQPSGPTITNCRRDSI
jgi:hypothetical protein